MKLTMHYMTLYPEREFRVIAQMLNNAKLLSSMSFEQSEDLNAAGKVTDAEDNFIYEEFLREVDQLSNRVAAVALNSLVEVTLKQIVLARRPGLKGANRMDRKELEQEFTKLGIDLNNIYFNDVDELRQVANSIKHSGNITVDSAAIENYYARSKAFLSQVCTESAAIA